MPGKNTIKKIATIVLILVFNQKMGMGLYLHNWLHNTKTHGAASSPLTNQELTFACNCFNDFTTPLTETVTQELVVPRQTVNIITAETVAALPEIYKFFHSLRAPPALIA